jgi:putative transposase
MGCDNGERVRIAFTLGCCDRDTISWVATTSGINSGDVRDLMIESVEQRFRLVSRCPLSIERLSDNGSPIPHARPGCWRARSAWCRAPS